MVGHTENQEQQFEQCFEQSTEPIIHLILNQSGTVYVSETLIGNMFQAGVH
jgi:hypothetical protein